MRMMVSRGFGWVLIPNRPFEVTFRMGQTDGIIKGLEEAVMTMSQGETSRFFLAPDLAYGDLELKCCVELRDQGTDQVPPGATLEYEISLLNVVDMDPDIDEFDEDFEIPEDLEPHRLIA
eukprot:g26248.t1